MFSHIMKKRKDSFLRHRCVFRWHYLFLLNRFLLLFCVIIVSMSARKKAIHSPFFYNMAATINDAAPTTAPRVVVIAEEVASWLLVVGLGIWFHWYTSISLMVFSLYGKCVIDRHVVYFVCPVCELRLLIHKIHKNFSLKAIQHKKQRPRLFLFGGGLKSCWLASTFGRTVTGG